MQDSLPSIVQGDLASSKAIVIPKLFCDSTILYSCIYILYSCIYIGVSFSGDIQDPPGQDPVQPSVGDPALAGGLD